VRSPLGWEASNEVYTNTHESTNKVILSLSSESQNAGGEQGFFFFLGGGGGGRGGGGGGYLDCKNKKKF